MNDKTEDMSVISQLNVHQNCLESIFSGTFSIHEIKPVIRQNFKVAKENNIALFLNDCRFVEGNITLLDAYTIIDFYESERSLKAWKEAIILSDSPEVADVMRFYEMASQNRGFAVKVFTSRQAGLKWLLS